MNANRCHYHRPCATTRLERDRAHMQVIRRRVERARKRNRYDPFAELNALSLLGLVIILCILAVDLFTSGGVL